MALSSNFLTEVENPNFRGNIVVSIDGTYFSQYLPDSGLAMDGDKVGLLDNGKINGVSVDLRKADTPIATISFDLLDKNAIVSSFMGNSDNSLQNSEVKFYFGFITGSYDFSDYALLGTTRINNISKEANGYKFSSKEVTDLMQRSLLYTTTNLDASITETSTSIDLISADNFPTSGLIKIGDEFMQYAGKAGNTLTGVARGDLASTIEEHDAGDDVYLVTKKDASSMDIVLDVLLNDLAIDPALIDIASITDLRDDVFAGESNYVLYIYEVENALKWLEEKIFIATNTRVFSNNGLITMALLDQVPKFEDMPEITEEHTTSVPSWRLSSDRIINKVVVKWNWSEGAQKFLSTNTYTDDESIAIFDERASHTLELYGVFDGAIVSNRANRMLARFSTPKASIKCKTHLNRLGINIADSVRLTNRHLPQPGGSLGFTDTLEVISRSISRLETGAYIQFGLEFSSYTGIRFGLIQPSPKLTYTYIDQKTVEVPDGTCYGVGYRIRLYDNQNSVYYNDAINEIVAVNGNILTFKDDFTTYLDATCSLFFAEYDNASGDQRAVYAWTCPDSGIFPIDGSKAFQIIF